MFVVFSYGPFLGSDCVPPLICSGMGRWVQTCTRYEVQGFTGIPETLWVLPPKHDPGVWGGRWCGHPPPQAFPYLQRCRLLGGILPLAPKKFSLHGVVVGGWSRPPHLWWIIPTKPPRTAPVWPNPESVPILPVTICPVVVHALTAANRRLCPRP